MQDSHNFIWLMIAVFFVFLAGMVFNAWRKHHETLGRKLRGLGHHEVFPFDAEKEKNRARAAYKGEALARALEEIELKAQTEAVAAETWARYRKSQQKALQLMISIGVVLVIGCLYTLYRFFSPR